MSVVCSQQIFPLGPGLWTYHSFLVGLFLYRPTFHHIKSLVIYLPMVSVLFDLYDLLDSTRPTGLVSLSPILSVLYFNFSTHSRPSRVCDGTSDATFHTQT